MALKKIMQKLDTGVRVSLDRALSRNLTARYVIALGVIAFLSVTGQIIIQVSLSRQTLTQDELRALDARVPALEALKKTLYAIELSSNPQETQKHLAVIKSLVPQSAGALESKVLPELQRSHLIETQENATRFLAALEAAVQASQSKTAKKPPRVQSEMTASVEGLLGATTMQLTEIKNALTFLELHHRNQIVRFKQIELLLMLLTLVVLLLEALYVFRPAVESLYEALRIRSDFLARMGHEIRNPMNSIIGMANLLDETPINEQQKRYVSILRRSSRGLLEMLNNLLDFSSIESGKLRLERTPFDLYDTLERALDLAVAGAHANGIELVLDLGERVPLKVVGDQLRIGQVLANLLGNAVKFTRKGQVTLKITREHFPEPGYAAIGFSVIDTGVGIDPKKLESVFDPFVQEDSSVKRRFGGTGLGLSIASQLVERMGGRLQVESVKGEGSTFSFTLRLPVTEEYDVAKAAEKLSQRPYKVALVEDNESICAVLGNLVRIGGGEVTRVIDKASLSKTLLATDENQLVVIDFESAREGLEPALLALKKSGFSVDHMIVLLKTTALSSDLETLGRLGLKNFLFKPVKPLQFFEAIHGALTGMPEPEAGLAAQASHAPRSGQSTALRILVADDSKDNQTLVSLYLKSIPHELVFADDGKQAFQKFKESHYDIVLMDLQMPEMDGYTATKLIRDWERSVHYPTVPIVAISAHDHSYNSERFKNAGFTEYVMKPVGAKNLIDLIYRLTDEAQAANGGSRARREKSAIDPVAQIEQQLAKLAPTYLANRKKEFEDLDRFFNDGDFKSIQTVGHRLKGNAKSYGFGGLADIGAQLEIAAREKDAAKVRALLDQGREFVAKASSN